MSAATAAVISNTSGTFRLCKHQIVILLSKLGYTYLCSRTVRVWQFICMIYSLIKARISVISGRNTLMASAGIDVKVPSKSNSDNVILYLAFSDIYVLCICLMEDHHF